MKSVNIVILMGNMTRDPELRYTPNGRAVAQVGLAVNRQFKDASGETRKEVDFFDVVAWGKLAEIISQYGKKGQGIHVTGRLQTRSWEAQDGSKRNKTEVIANDISLVGGRGDRPAEAMEYATEPQSAPAEPAGDDDISIDDIPF